MCLHAHVHGFVCMRTLPFSLIRPLCRHNPSVYEITRAHLCSGGSHFGSEEASAGNHLGSTQSSFHSASPVPSTLWPKLFTLKGRGTKIHVWVFIQLWNSVFRSNSWVVLSHCNTNKHKEIKVIMAEVAAMRIHCMISIKCHYTYLHILQDITFKYKKMCVHK